MNENPDDFNRFEKSMWEQRAGDYAEAFEALTALSIQPLLDAAGVHTGSEVLDVGTGPGFVAAAAAARGARVTGIDVAEAMVEIAHRRVPGGAFRLGSAEELPLPDAVFDAVVGNFVLLHLGHPERGAAEAHRVLRPGGRCAFTVWASAAANRALGVFHDAVDAAGVVPSADIPQGPPMFRFGNHDAFAEVLRDASFTDIRIEECSGTLRVDPGTWWNCVLRSTPRTGALIARQAPEARAEVRRRYDALVAPYADDGDVVLPVAAVLASGVVPNS